VAWRDLACFAAWHFALHVDKEVELSRNAPFVKKTGGEQDKIHVEFYHDESRAFSEKASVR
jgi:hypothetical protein